MVHHLGVSSMEAPYGCPPVHPGVAWRRQPGWRLPGTTVVWRRKPEDYEEALAARLASG